MPAATIFVLEIQTASCTCLNTMSSSHLHLLSLACWKRIPVLIEFIGWSSKQVILVMFDSFRLCLISWIDCDNKKRNCYFYRVYIMGIAMRLFVQHILPTNKIYTKVPHHYAETNIRVARRSGFLHHNVLISAIDQWDGDLNFFLKNRCCCYKLPCQLWCVTETWQNIYLFFLSVVHKMLQYDWFSLIEYEKKICFVPHGIRNWLYL